MADKSEKIKEKVKVKSIICTEYFLGKQIRFNK
jgi:hypothetical protein